MAIGLARLGVGKLILVDKDVVEEHNLNRQILFTKEDVGKSKVKQAHERILQHIVSSKTQVESHHMDVLPNW